MKKLVILGAGTAGTMVASRMNKLLSPSEWSITIVDQDPVHYYQPGFLLIPFGMYQEKDVVQPKKNYIPARVNYIQTQIERIEPDANKVFLANQTTLDYDFLVVATGADIHPEETPGLSEHEWGKSIDTFYNLPGALNLAKKLANFNSGRMVVNVVETPIKCPVAPLEFLMLADWYFTKRGVRKNVELVYATPLPGAFTKPAASAVLGHVLEEKGIKVETEYMVEHVDPDEKKLVSYDEREVPFDLLVSIPLNKGADVIGKSGMGNELNFVPVNKNTLLADKYNNVFVMGDASNTPASKAGSVAHFAVELFCEQFVRYTQGKALEPYFDGHANCFLESGFGKGLLIDFNYEVEPLPGTYPLPVIGPMALLEESVFNHWGKLAFRWMYWNILLKGRNMPVPARMSMAGKHPVNAAH